MEFKLYFFLGRNIEDMQLEEELEKKSLFGTLVLET